MYEYHAKVLRWVDGDTLDAEFDLGLYVSVKERVRLLSSKGGVDTPEMNSPLIVERAGARTALARVQQLAPAGSPFTAQTAKADTWDKYGRFLSRVVLPDGRDVGDILLNEGLAIEWQKKS